MLKTKFLQKDLFPKTWGGNSESKKVLVKKNVVSTIILGPKRFCIQKNLGPHIFALKKLYAKKLTSKKKQALHLLGKL